jgi:hypothetical protein
MTSTLTREQIEAMEAGLEMRTRVAELMGWRQDTKNPGCWIPPGKKPLSTGYYTAKPGNYPEDIAAAWEVVVHRMSLDTCCRGVEVKQLDEGGYWCRYGYCEASGNTAPLAICRAALIATPETP